MCPFGDRNSCANVRLHTVKATAGLHGEVEGYLDARLLNVGIEAFFLVRHQLVGESGGRGMGGEEAEEAEEGEE